MRTRPSQLARRVKWRARRIAVRGTRALTGRCLHLLVLDRFDTKDVEVPGRWGPRYDHMRHREVRRCVVCDLERPGPWERV